MPVIELKDTRNAVRGSLTLPESVFGQAERDDLMHASVVNYLANQRQGTHATKTKGLVSGGGKKPWKQKHTGRARAGSNRSPLWRKGGTIFGPQPRDYSYRIPKAVRRQALAAALSAKLSGGEITVVEGLAFERPRTKAMVEILRNLGLEGKSTLVILPEKDEAVLRSARNIPGVHVARARDLNPYAVLTHERILMTRGAADAIGEAGGQ